MSHFVERAVVDIGGKLKRKASSFQEQLDVEWTTQYPKLSVHPDGTVTAQAGDSSEGKGVKFGPRNPQGGGKELISTCVL